MDDNIAYSKTVTFLIQFSNTNYSVVAIGWNSTDDYFVATTIRVKNTNNFTCRKWFSNSFEATKHNFQWMVEGY